MNRYSAPCRICGIVLLGTPRSLPEGQRTCHPCRARLRTEAPAVKPAPPPRTCAQCGNSYSGRGRSPFCSDACKPRCAECHRPALSRGLCDAHYKRKYQPNRSHGAMGIVEWKKLHPDLAAAGYKDKQHRRRARLHNAPSEPIDRQRVGIRDGWRCGICRRKVDPALRAPHPKSQSLDHIEPLSRGGTHTYANVRIAHLRCNVDRSNRFDYEQLALFG